MRWLALAALMLAGATAQAATPANGPGRYAPRDECGRLAGAAPFRAALARAVRRRDADALVALAAPEVRLDFGGGAGRALLRRRLRAAEGRELWRELDRLLQLGCAVQQGNLTLPWFFAQDLGDVDPFDVWLAAGPRVALRPRPGFDDRPVRNLSWQLVTIVPPDVFRGPYRHVRLQGTQITGYVEFAQLRSPADYRLIARRKGKTWQIDAFIAGD